MSDPTGYTMDKDGSRLRRVYLVLAESYTVGDGGPEARRRFCRKALEEGRLPEDWRELLRWRARHLGATEEELRASARGGEG